jgi:uncharacterized protein YecE (DUF72 family)
MRAYVGTSGFSYPEWVGPFYPEDLPEDEWLSYYAARLTTVEINNSFYRVPKTSVVEGWAARVPADFRIVLKVTRRVTHFARLAEAAAESMAYMWSAAQALGERRGPLLFQLPPNLRAEPARLEAFLGALPEGARHAAFEFRHASWRAPEISALLARHGAALCFADAEEDPGLPMPNGVPFGYLRLRRPGYGEAELDRLAVAVRAAGWESVFAFFKHEDAGAGAALAQAFRTRLEAL